MKSFVEVKKSKIQGKGVYTKLDIKKGSVIYIVKGHIHKFHPDDDSWSLPHSISYAKNSWINPYPTNPLRFTNHSCNPNAIISHKLKVIALKNIKSGEEVTIDYSFTEDDPKYPVEHNCLCKDPKCRKVIHTLHNISEEHFKKHKRHLRKWIIESYEKKKKLKNLKV